MRASSRACCKEKIDSSCSRAAAVEPRAHLRVVDWRYVDVSPSDGSPVLARVSRAAPWTCPGPKYGKFLASSRGLLLEIREVVVWNELPAAESHYIVVWEPLSAGEFVFQCEHVHKGHTVKARTCISWLSDDCRWTSWCSPTAQHQRGKWLRLSNAYSCQPFVRQRAAAASIARWVARRGVSPHILLYRTPVKCCHRPLYRPRQLSLNSTATRPENSNVSAPDSGIYVSYASIRNNWRQQERSTHPECTVSASLMGRTTSDMCCATSGRYRGTSVRYHATSEINHENACYICNSFYFSINNEI